MRLRTLFTKSVGHTNSTHLTQELISGGDSQSISDLLNEHQQSHRASREVSVQWGSEYLKI